MKRFAGLVCAAMAATVLIASCSKDKESGSIAFDSPAVFLQSGDEATVGFSASNIESFSITGKPEGWNEPIIDAANRTVTVVSPVTFDDDVVKSGSVTMVGRVRGGSSVSATLFVGVVNTEDLSGKPANSYIVNKPETNYLIDPMYRGDVMTVLPASVDVVWQSKSGLIQYTELRDNKVSFYVGADSDDATKIKEGNAVIGAYNEAGTLIWSWHIWAVNYDPDNNPIVLTGSDGSYIVMNRNLGALSNDNSTKENILASYGLYYQWGRKDPFIGPGTYNAAKGESAPMYNGGGSRVYLKTEASSAETGTMAYATQHPLTFITGVSGSENDWLWSAHSDDLWSDTKTPNDPCPYGWRVVSSGAFDHLYIMNTPEAGDADKFGWTLSGPGSYQMLLIGAGRRRYDNGSILNIYNPAPAVRSVAEEAQPWEGLYWTTGTQSGTKSSAFHFWFEKKTTTGGVENNVPYARANGMSVRCVKLKNQ